MPTTPDGNVELPELLRGADAKSDMSLGALCSENGKDSAGSRASRGLRGLPGALAALLAFRTRRQGAAVQEHVPVFSPTRIR